MSIDRRSKRVVGASLLAGVAGVSLCVAVATTHAATTTEVVGDEQIDGPADLRGPAQPADAALDLALLYEAAIEIGENDDDALAGLIDETSQLKGLEDRPPATYTGLVRRAEGDVELINQVLRSEGFYDGEVIFAIDDKATPAKVTMTVTPGARYTLAAYDVVWQSGAPPAEVEVSPGLEIGRPAAAKPIADAQTRIVESLKKQGRPFARVVDRVVRIDRKAKTLLVTLTVEAGPYAAFGPVAIEGLERLDPGFVRNKIPWREGERYDEARVEELRTSLLAVGLFNSVKVENAEKPNPDGRLPMTITVVEGLYRSVGAGAAYSTSEGFLLDAFWEHRNLFGEAEKLRVSATVGTLTQRLRGEIRKPDFLRLDQDLIASSGFIRTNSDAYDEKTWSNYLGLDRKLSERWRATAGGTFELSRVTDQDSSDSVQLSGVPMSATRDNRDDVLNPTRGSRLNFELVPYTGHSSETLTFALGRVSASSYVAFDRRRRIILAGRARVASLFGEETVVIPANKRLYAGGGGSIRGYEYQKVGPLDAENDPVGGSSLFEVGLELRVRVTEEIGIVPFVDGGNVWDDNVPDPFAQLRWAAGLGLRYHTPIGPARVDVAVPIDRRKNIDDAFQLYFSLGQAF